MTICLVSSIIILTSYVLAVCTRWGLPDSLSQTWFTIKHRWIFSAVMVTSFSLLFAPLTEVLPVAWEWCVFVTCAGGAFIGFAPNLKDDLEEKVHMTGAAMLALGSQASVAVLCPWLLFAWLAWIPLAFRSQRVFWAEMIGGLTLMVAVVMEYV